VDGVVGKTNIVVILALKNLVLFSMIVLLFHRTNVDLEEEIL